MLRIASRVGRLVTTAACLAAVATVLALVAVSVSGQQVFTVISGSMTPTFVAGDVVLVRDVEPAELEPGMVVTFHAPGQPDHLTTHRILALHTMDEGLFVQTKGDANEDPDADFTNASAVVGQVTAITPWVGHWLVFYQSGVGRMVVLGIPLVLLSLGQGLQIWRDVQRARLRRRSAVAAAPTRSQRRGVRTPALTYALVTALSLSAVAGGVVVGKSTSATYTAAATTPASFSTRAFCTATDYRTAVLTGSPAPALYYRLEETSGGVAADLSTNNRPATYSGGFALNQAGGVCGGSRATRFTGSGQLDPNVVIGGTTATTNTYSLEAWVRTTAGGQIANLSSGRSTLLTRHLYVGTNGRVYFTANNAVVLSSPGSVADNTWHHVVVTTNGSASTLYVDGASVATGAGDAGIIYALPGFGATSVPGGSAPSVPSTAATNITLDEPALYLSVVPAATVASHFAEAGGN